MNILLVYGHLNEHFQVSVVFTVHWINGERGIKYRLNHILSGFEYLTYKVISCFTHTYKRI